MLVKLEISNNHLKITKGSNSPIRHPYRDSTFIADVVRETIVIKPLNSENPILPVFAYADEPAQGTVNIDTVSPTKATSTVQCASVVGAVFANGTVICSSVLENDIVTINNLVYTAVNGVKSNNTEFDMSGTDTQTATDLADSITNDTRPGALDDVTAISAIGTVTASSTVRGVGGNAITLTSSDAGRLAVSAGTFVNGVDGDIVTVNELPFLAVVDSKDDNTQFSVDTGDNETATDLADSITNDARPGAVNDCVASATTDTVTITTSVGGVVGNATTLTSSGATLIVSGALFTGGLDDAEMTMITVNAIDIMSGAETSIEDSDVLASAVAANITAHTSVPNYSAVSIGPLITITADDDDTNVNGFVVGSTPSKATTTDVNMAGATANIVDSAGDPFDTWDDLITWLEKNTGGELIV